ncbi:MAG: glycosyltransferase [Treponema sp.]|jgi:glycosyltransferase involved in cell wall biosynthesis|nr:glycosyltransferase [Treponema sp.]
MKVSIIIPALDEEAILPRLLDSIKAQDFDDYEVIVADARSRDRTREVAAHYGCLVVEGGSPAAGRNAGARAATGELLYFLDADVILPPGFIRNVHDEMQDRFIDLATCEIKPLSDYQLDRVIHKLINLAVILNLWIDPKAFGFCIFVTKRLFDRVDGFDETIYVAEDNNFVKRASVFRPLHFLGSACVMVSVRRFEKEGRFAYVRKGIKLNLYRTFKGEIRNDGVVKYEFGAFDKTDRNENSDVLDKIERQLLKLEEHSRRYIRASAGRDLQKELRPHINEYSHLISDLDAYLGRRERKTLLREKWKNFFGPGKRKGGPA